MSTSGCEYHQKNLIELFEGALDPAASAEARSHIQTCPACRAEYDWLVSAGADLEEIGNGFAQRTPELDIIDEVMARVTAMAAPAPKTIPFRAPRRFPTGYAGLLGLAAAAGIVLFFWVAIGHNDTSEEQNNLAQNRQNAGPSAIEHSAESVTPTGNQQSSLDELQKAINVLHKYDTVTPVKKAVFEHTTPPDLHTVTTSDVLAATRAAVTDPEARDRLHKWASLAPDQAKQVAEAPNASPGAIIGAAASLDPSEAAPLLLTALGSYSDKPAAQLALSKTYLGRTQTTAAAPSTDALSALDNLIASDPKNALSYCLKALLLLEQAQPDVQGALKLLNQASALPTANAYGLESAAFNREALIAAGMSPDTASTLSALTAGQSQHDFLVNLSQDLLDKAKQSVNQGDLQTAKTISEAVQQLGTQLDQSPQLSQERLAALEMQREAITLLQTIYSSLGSTADIQQLTLDTQKLAGSMENLSNFLTDLGNLFLGATDQVFGLITNIIGQTGDLTIFDHLPT